MKLARKIQNIHLKAGPEWLVFDIYVGAVIIESWIKPDRYGSFQLGSKIDMKRESFFDAAYKIGGKEAAEIEIYSKSPIEDENIII